MDLLSVTAPPAYHLACGCLLVNLWTDAVLGLLLPTWLLARVFNTESNAADQRAAAERLAAGQQPTTAEAGVRCTACLKCPLTVLVGAAVAWRLAEAADSVFAAS